MRPPSILVRLVDDDEGVRHSLQQTLELANLQVQSFATARPALTGIGLQWPGIIITDIRMPGMDGLQLAEKIRKIDPEIPVVMVSAHGDIKIAVQAIQQGAYDFIEKPADPDYLLEIIKRAVEKRGLILENRRLRHDLCNIDDLPARLIGRSPVMENLRHKISLLAEADVDVLVSGATGTGKELVARCIHEVSDRKDRHFVAINCGALPESLFESELFGHEAGAFTGASKSRVGKIEYAHGGTLFLDEIESMPMSLQVKLLRVLQERVVERIGSNHQIAVDIRVIAATKEDLLEKSEQGTFRNDLYYRLSVVCLDLPTLCERGNDIALLFHHFVEQAKQRHHKNPATISADLLAWLHQQSWAGNVRELRHAAERHVLGMGVGPGAGLLDRVSEHALRKDGPDRSLPEQLGDYEKTILQRALQEHKGHVGVVARALGIPRKTLYLRMKRHRLKRGDFH